MERVEHPHRVGQLRGQRGGVPAERVQRRGRHRGLPSLGAARPATRPARCPSGPRPRRAAALAGRGSGRRCRWRTVVGWVPVARRNAVSSTPTARTGADLGRRRGGSSRAGSSISGVPRSMTWSHHRPPRHPQLRPRSGRPPRRARRPARTPTAGPARSDIARGAIAACRSVQVLPRTTDAGSTRPASTSTAPPAAHRSAGRAPSSGGGPSPAPPPRTPGSRPGPRWSPPAARARRRPPRAARTSNPSNPSRAAVTAS